MNFELENNTVAKASAKNLRVSPQKLNLIASAIRGKSVERALAFLQFSPKAASIDVRKTLASAVANAQRQNQIDADQLFVKAAWVGKGLTLKRLSIRARGRTNRINKCFSHLQLYLAVKEGDVSGSES